MCVCVQGETAGGEKKKRKKKVYPCSSLDFLRPFVCRSVRQYIPGCLPACLPACLSVFPGFLWLAQKSWGWRPERIFILNSDFLLPGCPYVDSPLHLLVTLFCYSRKLNVVGKSSRVEGKNSHIFFSDFKTSCTLPENGGPAFKIKLNPGTCGKPFLTTLKLEITKWCKIKEQD